MKKYSHAWIAFMAIKRLEVIATTEDENVVKGVNADVRKEAKALVRWFKDYRDFVIKGAWYPDDVFKDMSQSHIVKYKPTDNGPYTSFRNLPTTHSIVDNFKILHREEKGCPIAISVNHIAMRFFILSHYVADCHMPLHCDHRPFSDESGIHGAIEKRWEDNVKKSYKIDTDNNRFYYDPDGYPLPLSPRPLMQAVEQEVVSRPYTHGWGTNNKSTWDYMSAVSQYSYLFAYHLIPEDFTNTRTFNEFLDETEWGQHFDDYSLMIFADAIDSIARIWLHVWIKYRDWAK